MGHNLYAIGNAIGNEKIAKTKKVNDNTPISEVQFQSVKCAVVTRLRKNFKQVLFPSQAMQGNYSVLI